MNTSSAITRARPDTPPLTPLPLDSFDPAVRRQALADLCARPQWPPPARAVNLHAHTFFSYNVYRYSPTHFAVLARERGLAVAGIVDFDVLDGLEEFHAAGRRLGLKTVVSIESRVFVPEFATRVINSPGEPGIAYHMGVGFTRVPSHPMLTQMRATAAERNRALVGRVNRFTAPVTLDYDRDVLPLTPAGNATERHICEAYAQRGESEFWRQKLGDWPAGEAPRQALIRAKTMKQGGAGYVAPEAGSFPRLEEMNRFVREAGAIPTVAWLDGLSEGERALEEWLRATMSTGAAGLNIIPDRNYTPGVRDQKLQNLHEVVALAERLGLPVFVGTEMNAPGNKFVDDFDSKELAPLVPVFLKGAHIAYAHTALERAARLGYGSDWARSHFPDPAARNEFYGELGARLDPSHESFLHAVTDRSRPAQMLDLIKPKQPTT